MRVVVAGGIKVGGKAGADADAGSGDCALKGVAYVPEDRQHHGLLLPLSISLNTSLADLGAVSTAGVLFQSRERSLAEV